MSGAFAKVFNPTPTTLAAGGFGFLLPALTTAQRLALAAPDLAPGLTVYDTDIAAQYYWNGTLWVAVTTGGGPVLPLSIANGGTGATTVGQALINLSCVPGGDLGGPTVSAALVLKSSTSFALSSATQYIAPGNNVAIAANASVFEIGGPGTLTGLDATGSQDGRIIILTTRPTSGSAFAVTLSQESASSLAQNRIVYGAFTKLYGPEGTIVLQSGAAVILQYVRNGSGNYRWIVLGTTAPAVGGDLRAPLCDAAVVRASQEFSFGPNTFASVLFASNQNNLAVNTDTCVFQTGCTGAGPFNLTGISSTSANGRVLYLYVRADQPSGWILIENSASSIAGNRFFMGGRGSYRIDPGSIVELQYRTDGAVATAGWYLIGTPAVPYLQHVIGAPVAGLAPTIAAGAGAGAAPTVAIAGSDLAGQITVTPGVGPAAGAVVVTVTFRLAFPTAPYVLLTPANSATGLLAFVVFPTATTTTFTLTVPAASVLVNGTAYAWNYHVVG